MPLMIYQLDFSGGPEDGLRGHCFHVPDTRLVFPTGYVPDGPTTVAYSRVADTTAAVYEFERTIVTGQPMNCVPVMRYRFVGFTTPASLPLEAKVAARGIRWLARVGRMLRNWFAAPVTYPLQVMRAREECQPTSRP